jgi:hypothetical protein
MSFQTARHRTSGTASATFEYNCFFRESYSGGDALFHLPTMHESCGGTFVESEDQRRESPRLDVDPEMKGVQTVFEFQFQ